MLAVDFDVRHIVFEYGRDVHLRKREQSVKQDTVDSVTSGNVPLENTIRRQVCKRRYSETMMRMYIIWIRTDLAAGTVAHDDKLSTDFRHGR